MRHDNRMNLCTATLQIAPEAYGEGDTVHVRYSCEKDGFMVSACRYFKPMTCAGGLICNGECEYFDNGCNNKYAIRNAKKRAEGIVKSWLAGL